MTTQQYPLWEELPEIELYLDQVLLYVNQVTQSTLGPNDKGLTASMVNNYVKHGHVAKPIKKKYNAAQVARLIVITSLKTVFEISEIAKTLEILRTDGQRRNDLIPNLVNTVKGYSKYEAGTLEKVTALRNQLAGMNMEDDPQKTMEVSNQLSGTLKSLFAVSEAYPDLKASAEYQKLMEELTNTENKIAYSRQLYNSCVRRFNEKLQAFPSNLVGKIHHFTQFEYLQVPAEARETPKVEF